MLHSSHYNLNLAEGTDLVNPLTVDVPNYQAIDSAMFANEQAGVGTATELKSGTIHAITRANTNRNVFRFKSTSVFLAGDTFTVDGGAVTALYPDGSSLKDRCFIIGSDVLCLLDGAQLTVLATFYPEAQNVTFDDTNVSYTASNVQTAIDNASTATGTEYSSGVSVKDKIDNLITISDITETTDSSGRILLDSSVATTDNFISAIPLSIGSTFIKVAKRYNSEGATALWLFFVDNDNNALANTSVKFRVLHL